MAAIRMSIEQYEDIIRGRNQKIDAQVAEVKKNKYNNKRMKVDGINFDSKAEALYYEYNKLRIRLGELSHQHMQVPFHMANGKKYIVDFLEVLPSGLIRYVDVKGKATDVFKLKKAQVELEFGVKIVCIKKMPGANHTFEEITVK